MNSIVSPRLCLHVPLHSYLGFERRPIFCELSDRKNVICSVTSDRRGKVLMVKVPISCIAYHQCCLPRVTAVSNM